MLSVSARVILEFTHHGTPSSLITERGRENQFGNKERNDFFKKIEWFGDEQRIPNCSEHIVHR